jgi:hypothetical protein
LLLQHLGSPPESGQTNALAIVTELANLQILFHLLFQILILKRILVFSNPSTEKGSFRCVKHHDGIMKMNAQRLKHAGELAYGLSLYELEKA